jgi:hypothetical protein
MHDPQVLILLAAGLAVLCWRVALKLLIGAAHAAWRSSASASSRR